VKLLHIVGMLYELSKSPNGLTAGAVAKRLGNDYSKAQVDRQLRKLVGEGVLHMESAPHRANITKNVYHIKQEVIEDLAHVVECYDSSPHTQPLFRDFEHEHASENASLTTRATGFIEGRQ
jgi:hypothetical protein